MKNEHIIHILDNSPFEMLSLDELATIKTHTNGCGECLRAFEAASFSASLLKTRVEEVFEPTPFFETRVLAALREKQILQNPIAVFRRWWRAASGPVFAMLFIVAMLMALTIFAPQTVNDSQERATLLDGFSTDQVIMQKETSNSQLTTIQAMQIIYEQRDSR